VPSHKSFVVKIFPELSQSLFGGVAGTTWTAGTRDGAAPSHEIDGDKLVAGAAETDDESTVGGDDDVTISKYEPEVFSGLCAVVVAL